MDSYTKMRGTTMKRHEEIMHANDAIQRARAAGGAGRAAIDQARDRLGTPDAGKTQL